MSDTDDIDTSAAEYVLGTLDAGERAAVAARRSREPALDKAILAWEQRLSPLIQLAPSVTPPPALFPEIERRLATSRSAAAPESGAKVIEMQRTVRRWKLTAFAATAAAACLAIAIGFSQWPQPRAAQNYVAVFQKEDASPTFVMWINPAQKTLSVRRITDDMPAGKTYQLWIKADALGPDPKSLGLIDNRSVNLQQALAALDPATVETAVFGVSLEPAGGSPTGKPTGPATFAHLLPATL